MKKVFLLLLLFYQVIQSQTSGLTVTATGRQSYCPLSQIPIVTSFSISDPDNIGVNAFYIQISSGYQINLDELKLTGNHPNIIATWSNQEGKLVLRHQNGVRMDLVELENAVKSAVFESLTSSLTGEKFFSLSVGSANYLPSTGHYYEYVANTGITWTQARAEAETRRYFGLKGYLATILSADEAQITGEQALGAGWIGGSDAEQEGVWKWVTGPEAGTIFWEGGVSGTTPNFAFWNSGEPNNFGEEHYAHVTDPSIGVPGSWNDLKVEGDPPGPYHPKGYIVEYGGSPGDPNIINISASTSIYVPLITETTDNTICVVGSTTLTATASHGEVLWFDSSFGGNQIATGNTFTTPFLASTETYYVGAAEPGCTETATRIPVTATVIPSPRITSVENDFICEPGKGIMSAESSAGDILWYETPTSTNPIFTGDVYDVFVNTSTVFYVEADVNGCKSATRTPVEIIIDNNTPDFDVISETFLCLNEGSVDIPITNPNIPNLIYHWTDSGANTVSNSEVATISEPGLYSVVARSIAGCTSEVKTVLVKPSETATLNINTVIINDATDVNSVTILTNQIGTGEYVFSLDDKDGNYTSSNIITNIPPGLHTLYAKDVNGCGISEFQFSVLNISRFMSPNGDGENDFWRLKGLNKDFYTSFEVSIIDRFGKVVHRLNQNTIGWDGTYNGKPLPSSSYWYHLKLVAVNGRVTERKGSFSLIRK